MATYLLSWNPDMWHWPEEAITEDIGQLAKLGPEGFVRFKRPSWSIGTNYRRMRQGDRLFLARVGTEPRGIFASGHTTSDPYQAPHWNEEGRLLWYVDVAWDVLLNPYDPEAMLSRDELKSISARRRWSPQASGEHIEEEVAARLEAEWQHLIGTSTNTILPKGDQTIVEGEVAQSLTTKYERDPSARRRCIAAHGVSCSVCSFDFGEVYGDIGEGYIHVHHLLPLSSIGVAHAVDPVKDMRPVCPNCHAMLHRRNPPYTVEELQGMRLGRPGVARGWGWWRRDRT